MYQSADNVVFASHPGSGSLPGKISGPDINALYSVVLECETNVAILNGLQHEKLVEDCASAVEYPIETVEKISMCGNWDNGPSYGFIQADDALNLIRSTLFESSPLYTSVATVT